MSGRRANPRLIKLHRSYTVPEAARVLGVHKNSIRSWIKAGLPTVEKSRPMLIHGDEMRAWLDKKRKEAKRPCPPGAFFCLKCRAPKSPALGMVEFQPFSETSGSLIALCTDCDTMMFRRARRDRISAVMPGLAVQYREADVSIIERQLPSLNCNKLTEG